MHIALSIFLPGILLFSGAPAQIEKRTFTPITHNRPEATADLAVGLYASPVVLDRNGDGHYDLMVVSGGVNHETRFFENTGRKDPRTGVALFKRGVRTSEGNRRLSYNYLTFYLTDAGTRVLSPRSEYPDFINTGLAYPVPIRASEEIRKMDGRGNQWSLVDFDGDGARDLVIGLGQWGDYASEMGTGFDENGVWISGPLHGYVYVALNRGSDDKPDFAPPQQLQAGGRPVDVYGTPSPVFADFRGTGRLDLICGEFIDGFTFFENTGTRTKPEYRQGYRLRTAKGLLKMPGCMIVVNVADWNRDGLPDLIVAQEDGRVAWIENTGRQIMVPDRQGLQAVAYVPEFTEPMFFREEADKVKFGVITSPVAWDWDDDGDEDILTGNAVGEIGIIENLGGYPPRWAEPRVLEAAGAPIKITAGHNGSIQGPSEAKWGYTNVGVGDWDGDGIKDIVAQLITGQVVWFRNSGSAKRAEFTAMQPAKVAWLAEPPKPWNTWRKLGPHELVVQWRSTPCVIDLDSDGLSDLVTIDHDGFLAFFRQVLREEGRVLLPGERIFQRKTRTGVEPLLLNKNRGGHGGRKTYCFTDWDGDGKLDLFVNSENADYYRNISTRPGEWLFENRGRVGAGILGGYSTCPAVFDLDKNGVPDLLLGAEDGYYHALINPRVGANWDARKDP